MITNFKIFEKNNAKLYNYILAGITNINKDFEDFINNNIGQIINIKHYNYSGMKCDEIELEVEYDNVPQKIKNEFVIKKGKYITFFDPDVIEITGKTKKEVKIKQSVNKFNI